MPSPATRGAFALPPECDYFVAAACFTKLLANSRDRNIGCGSASGVTTHPVYHQKHTAPCIRENAIFIAASQPARMRSRPGA